MSSKESLLNALDILAAPHVRLIAQVHQDMRKGHYDPKTLPEGYERSLSAIKTYRAASAALQGNNVG